MKPKYLRKLTNMRVLECSDILLRRKDMFPCDREGRLLSTHEFELPEASPNIQGPAQDKMIEELKGLQERARSLKIRGYNRMKHETLIEAIRKEEEKILEQENAEKAEKAAARVAREKASKPADEE